MKIYNDENSTLVREGFLEIRKLNNPYNESDKTPYEVINKKDACVCLVLTEDLKYIYTTKQYRPCNNDYELGFVAGICDKEGYTAEEIILDEIEEEIRISREDVISLEYVGSGFSSSGMTTEKVYRFIAIIKKGAMENHELQKADDTDLIIRQLVPFTAETYARLTSNTGQLLFMEAWRLLKSDKEFINPNLSKKKIAIYGGTFSPFHVQHLTTIVKLFELGFDKVVIVPVSDKYSKKKLSYKTRVDIINATLIDMPNKYIDKIDISDVEQTHFMPTTYQTMCRLRREYGFFNEYSFVTGTDNLLSLGVDNWDDGKELLSEFKTVAIERSGYTIESIYANGKCNVVLENRDNIVVVPPINENSISSTLIRERVLNGQDVFQYMTVNSHRLLTEKYKEELRINYL